MAKKCRTQRPKPPGDRWFVYMVRCADDSLYTGIAKDIARRWQQHNAGTASRYTRSRLPVVVVYEEGQRSRSLALKREAAIKAMTRRQKLALIDSNRPKRAKVRRDEPKPLCETCAWMREVVTPKGSRFLLCQLSKTDPAYPKYPPQPVVRCEGHY